MYPFFYRPMFEVIEDGWKSFLPQNAFKDLESMVCSCIVTKAFTFHCPRTLFYLLNTCLLSFHISLCQTDEWRLSEVNKDFTVCQTYPPLVAVPKDIDDDTLRKVATFRHSGRFPVLSYYHKKNGMVSTRTFTSCDSDCFCCWIFFGDLLCLTAASISNPVHSQVMMRSGQPLTGTNGRRCKEDEKLINATLRPGKRGYIIDTRTINIAQQAKARGGGFESEANYPQWRRIHKTIERCAME